MIKPPNILLIVSDQQRADMIGAVGRVPVQTPALDRLAREGTLFDRGYTPCPLCTPARASLLTGQYPSRHGAWSIGVDTPDEALSLPEQLRRHAGYRTAIIGKSHYKNCLNPGSFEAMPHVRNWDYFSKWTGPWFGFEHAEICVGHVHEPHAYGMHYGWWLREQGIPPEPPFFGPRGSAPFREEDGPEWQLPLACHPCTWAANRAISYLRDRRDDGEPFYLSLNLPEPHEPFLVPAPYHRMYDGTVLPEPVRRPNETEGRPSIYRASVENKLAQLGWHERFLPMGQGGREGSRSDGIERTAAEVRRWHTYMGMTTLMDAQVGRVLDSLDELGLAENTVVVFVSDHGDHMGDHWLWGKGGSHYDAGVRVPFIVRWPGRVPAGVRSPALQSLVDLPPTFLELAGVAVPAGMQGVVQGPVWAGQQASAREGVWIDQRLERGASVRSWITDRHRLSVHHIHAENRTETELYDLRADPSELVDLAGTSAHAGLQGDLLLAMSRYQDRISAPWAQRHELA